MKTWHIAITKHRKSSWWINASGDIGAQGVKIIIIIGRSDPNWKGKL